MMEYSGYLEKIAKCNRYTEEDKVPFLVDGKRVGEVKKEYLAYLLQSGLFVQKDGYITLHESLKSFERRTEALTKFAKDALNDGITDSFMNEPYAVLETPSAKPCCLVDRAISSLLGLIAFGQHLNGFVRTKPLRCCPNAISPSSDEIALSTRQHGFADGVSSTA